MTSMFGGSWGCECTVGFICYSFGSRKHVAGCFGYVCTVVIICKRL